MFITPESRNVSDNQSLFKRREGIRIEAFYFTETGLETNEVTCSRAAR